MKPILMTLFVFSLFSSRAQNVFKPHFGIAISTGPATYYNPIISNVGYVHDYKYGQAAQLGLKAIQSYNKWNFSASINYQFLYFAYQGVTSINQSNPNLPNSYFFDFYFSKSFHHLAQLKLGCARNLGHGIEIGVLLMPSYLIATNDNYTMERVWSYELPNMMNENIGWRKTQLIGGPTFSKYFISKKGNISQLSLNPQISLTNNGGFNVYNQAFSDLTDRKTRFVSCQLAYTVFF